MYLNRTDYIYIIDVSILLFIKTNMGITGLNTLLKKLSPENFVQANLSEFNGKYIAIDFPILVMRHLASQWGKYVKTKINIIKDKIDTEKISKSTITSIKNELKRLKYTYSIGIILVWEGKASSSKINNAHIRRKTIIENNIKKFDDALNEIPEDFNPTTDEEVNKYENITKLAKNSMKIPKELYEELEETLLRENYCILKCKGEAEELCTQLCIEKKVEAVYSTDTDCIIRGCPKLITKINNNGTCDITIYNPELLKKLKLNYDQFVDMAILAECDYNTGICGIGIMKAHKLIQKYSSLESFEKQAGYAEEIIKGLNYIECRKIYRQDSLEILCIDLSPLNNAVINSPEILILPN